MSEELVASMSMAELDAFPYGIIRLDRDATILYYNDAQAALSGIPGVKTLGLNFFRDIAPCAAVKNFEGRFHEFSATSGSRIEQFAFLFRFRDGDRAVTITFVRAAAEERTFLVVNPRALAA